MVNSPFSPLIRPSFLGGGGVALGGSGPLGSHESTTGPGQGAMPAPASTAGGCGPSQPLPCLEYTGSQGPAQCGERKGAVTALKRSQWGEVISFLKCQCDYCEHGNLPNWQNPTYHQFQLITHL